MQIKLLTMWNGFAAGKVLDLGKGQAELLIQRKVAVSTETKETGGIGGTVKAFFNPPQGKKKRG